MADITIWIEGGVIHEVTGLPKGVRLIINESDKDAVHNARLDNPEGVMEIDGKFYIQNVLEGK